MNILKKNRLKKRQKALMQERDWWERVQTDFSRDGEFYSFCQRKMQFLDEEAEQLRYVLEMGCCE